MSNTTEDNKVRHDSNEDVLAKHGFDGIDEQEAVDVDDSSPTLTDTELAENTPNIGVEQDELVDLTNTENGNEEDHDNETDEEVEPIESNASDTSIPLFKLIPDVNDVNSAEYTFNQTTIEKLFSSINENDAYNVTSRNASELITNSSQLVVDGIGRGGKSTHTRSIRMIRDNVLSSHNSDIIKNNVYNENFSGMKAAIVRAKSVSIEDVEWLSLGADSNYKNAILAKVKDDGESTLEDAAYYTNADVNNRASLLTKSLTFIIDYINNNLVVVSKMKKSDTDGDVFIFFEEDDKNLQSNLQISFTVLPDARQVIFAIKLNKSELDRDGVAYTNMFTKINDMFAQAGFTYTMEEVETIGLYTTFAVQLDLNIKFIVPILLLTSHVVVSAWNVENVIIPDSTRVSNAILKGGASVGSVAIISKLSIFVRRYSKTLTLEYLDLFSVDGAGLISANCNYVQLSGKFASTMTVADSNISEIRFRDANIPHVGVNVLENLYILITSLRNNFNISKKPEIARLIVAITKFSKTITNFMNMMNVPDKELELEYTIETLMATFANILDEELRATNIVCADLSKIMTENELLRMKLVL